MVIFEKINKIGKTLARMTKKQNRDHANKIINEHGDITNDLTEKNIYIRRYYEQLFVLQQIRQPR